MSQSQLERRVKKLFFEFDAEDTGGIDAGELRHFAGALGKSWNKKQLKAALRLLDADKGGSIGLDELLSFFNDVSSKLPSQDHTMLSRLSRLWCERCCRCYGVVVGYGLLWCVCGAVAYSARSHTAAAAAAYWGVAVRHRRRKLAMR